MCHRGFVEGRGCGGDVLEENLFGGKVLLKLLSKPLWAVTAGLWG